MAQSSVTRQFEGLPIKAFMLGSLVVMAMAVLVARLVWLQIVNNKYYHARAVENSTRVIFLRAPRGIIYDRHGSLIATNKQSLSMTAIPRQLEDIESLSQRLSQGLNLPVDEVRMRLETAKESDSVLPVVIDTDLDLNTVSWFYEQKLFLPGIDILPDISRNYPLGELTAHIVGYTGQITESQLKRRPERRMGDIVGQDGIERLYDVQLRGLDGEQRVRVNAAGHSVSAETSKPVVTREPKAGLPIVTSIDLDLQRIAYTALGDRHGAVVVADPQTGEIMALVSKPSFDPNVFTRRITPDVWKRLNAPDHPLFNRALSGNPPGSIWKPITLMAALDNKVVKPDSKIHVSGGIALGGFFFHDWTSASGNYDLVRCLAWSRDSAFYQMGLHLTPEQIKAWAVTCGFGRPTGIELLHERSGIVPDSEWKERVMHEKWYPGNTLHLSIGQSFTLVTPAQATRAYSGFGTRGKLPEQHLVIKIGDRQVPPPRCEEWHLKPEYMKVVSDGLKAVVAGGTGGATRLANIEVAGKTGSAEAPGGKTHAWFCCYAPADKPRIAICAFVEHGGHGGSAAAPIAKQILEKFFAIQAPAEQIAENKAARQQSSGTASATRRHR